MKLVEFEDNDVLVNGVKYGTILYDDKQKSWFLWSKGNDEDVHYFDDFSETKRAIKWAIQNH